MHRYPGLVLGLALMAITLAAGCAGLGTRLEPPPTTLVNIEVLEARALETIFLTELRVINTNDVPLVIKGLDCEIRINDRHFAVGLADEEVEVPPFGTAIVPVRAYTSTLDVAASLLKMMRDAGTDQPQKRFAYTIDGTLRLGGTALPRSIPFASDGEFSFQDLTRNVQSL